MLSLKKMFAGIIATAIVCLAPLTIGLAQTDDDKIDFATQVKPLLEKYCLHCHGPDEAEDDIRVDQKDSIIDMYVFEDETADESHFFDLLVTDDEEAKMPPKDEPQLSAEQIDIFRKWINQGAAWPEGLEFSAPVGEEPAADAENSEENNVDNSDGENAADNQNKSKKKSDDNFGFILWENSGVLHPALVHFPIALIIGGAFFALFGFRGDSPMGDAAYYCLWLAALSGILTCVVGWSYAEFMHKNGAHWNDFDFTKTIVLHRWGGILVTVLSLILAVIAYSNRRNDPYASGAVWKLGLVVLAGLVGYVGHLGGDMTHNGEVEDALKNLGIIQEPKADPEETISEEKEADANDSNDEESGDEESGDEESGDEESGDGGSEEGDGTEGDGSTSGDNDERSDQDDGNADNDDNDEDQSE